MATWLWMIFFMVFGTGMFFVGYFTGRMDADKAPNPQVWQNVRTHSIDASKAVNLHGIDMEHAENMAMIERGIYDNVPFNDPDDMHQGENQKNDDDDMFIDTTGMML